VVESAAGVEQLSRGLTESREGQMRDPVDDLADDLDLPDRGTSRSGSVLEA
jgi:hypothetical protein